MSIITDALKLATTQEKLISKQEAEIANLKVKLEAAINGKAAAEEATRIAREALKAVNQTAALELKEARRVANVALKGVRESHAVNLSVLNDEAKELKTEIRDLRAQLKVAQKSVTAPIPTNDALGQVKRRPGRPKKSATPEVTPEATPEVTLEVDPRQLNIPDLGAPAQGLSIKGNSYEFV